MELPVTMTVRLNLRTQFKTKRMIACKIHLISKTMATSPSTTRLQFLLFRFLHWDHENL